MIEPIPPNVSPPKENLILRVGIVLPEDHKKLLYLEVDGPGYQIVADGKPAEFPAGLVAAFSSDGQCTSVTLGRNSLKSSNPIRVIPPSSEPISPGGGIKVKNVPAGRGFHWQKEITETFSGEIEVLTRSESLVAISIVPLEDYIASVTSSEMNPRAPADCSKAQAVVARSWSLVFLGRKHPGMPFTICNDDDCQRYQGTTHLTHQSLEAVRTTRGEVLVNSSDFIVPAYYSKCCGGYSESALNAFGFPVQGVNSVPDAADLLGSKSLESEDAFRRFLGDDSANIYCSPQIVPKQELIKYLGPVDDEGAYFRWTQVINSAELIQNLQSKFGLQDARALLNFRFGQRGSSGRYLSCEIDWMDATKRSNVLRLPSQYELRRALDKKFLKSSAFSAELVKSASGEISELRLKGLGWGHGVGMCQIGSLGMALTGIGYDAILRHYFPDSRLHRI